jgi:alkylation response protein AidB-like acyl-CoA dehydrogenase
MYADDETPATSFAGPRFDAILADLSRMSAGLEDSAAAWPGGQFSRLAQAGVLGWVVPKEYVGTGISSSELMRGYEALAAACLVTTFVLTQRNGACQRIAGSENESLKAELLPALCSGSAFATVGISHLTTSRQHLARPSVEARETAFGFVFSGTVPWVTGARFADFLVTGGTCADGRQVLAAIPTSLSGVERVSPARLLALNASQTGSVELHNVAVDGQYVIAGPVDQIMKRGAGGGAGSLATSALALGAAAGALARLKVESHGRPELTEIYDSLEASRSAISADIQSLCRGDASDTDAARGAEAIRKRANSLVLRTSQAYLAASKGAGFIKGHPAERAVREAMFFLVWSCPQPVLDAALREFACAIEA